MKYQICLVYVYSILVLCLILALSALISVILFYFVLFFKI